MALHHSVVQYRSEFDVLIRDGNKRCTKCKQIKSLNEFSVNSRVYGGYSNHCTVCQSINWRKKKNKPINVDIINLDHMANHEQLELNLAGKRRCITCKKIKVVETDFQHRNNKWARFKNDCDSCRRLKILQSKSKKSEQGVQKRQNSRIKLWAKRVIESHKARNIEIIITINELISLVDNSGWSVCYYTGDKVLVGYGASVDMKDPKGKFEIDNVCVCSLCCNSSKSRMTESEFKEYLSVHPSILARIRKNNENQLKLYYVKRIPLEDLKKLAEQYNATTKS